MSQRLSAQKIIDRLKLKPLPLEGGYFRETYRSPDTIPAACLPRHPSDRNYSTAIYYLVTPTAFSALHRLPQDEIFHFYLGDPVEMIQIDEAGDLKRLILGQDILESCELQLLAPGSVWQGTRLLSGGHWALLGTTVAPGFDYADYEHGNREDLINRYPRHREAIERFTRP